MLSSAEAVISLGPMCNPEITERLLQTSKECVVELNYSSVISIKYDPFME